MAIWNDVVALAKAGWTPAQVKEIMEADKKTPDPEPDKKEDVKKDPEPEKKEEDPELDYKAMYEESQKKLKEAQKGNRENDDQPEDLSIDEIVKNITARL